MIHFYHKQFWDVSSFKEEVAKKHAMHQNSSIKHPWSSELNVTNFAMAQNTSVASFLLHF